jgi:hypothetical protein
MDGTSVSVPCIVDLTAGLAAETAAGEEAGLFIADNRNFTRFPRYAPH